MTAPEGSGSQGSQGSQGSGGSEVPGSSEGSPRDQQGPHEPSAARPPSEPQPAPAAQPGPTPPTTPSGQPATSSPLRPTGWTGGSPASLPHRSDPRPDPRPASGVPDRPSPLPPPRPTPPTSPTSTPSSPSGLPPRTVPSRVPTGPAATSATSSAAAATQTVVPRPGERTGPARPPLQAARPVRGRKARLALRRLDPWSVFVTSLMLSLFLAVATIVGAFVLYQLLGALGVTDSINQGVTDVKGGADPLTQGRFLGGAALLAALNVVLLTALATLGSLLYNLVATFTGGLELTLAERD